MTTSLLHWSLGIACTLSFAGLHCAADKTDPAAASPPPSSASSSTPAMTPKAGVPGATDTPLPDPDRITLPPPAGSSTMSLTEALQQRRSIRLFSPEAISLAELSAILWAGQGITADKKFRTAPSAGATYPLELYVTTRNVTGLPPGGLYHYESATHQLVRIRMAADIAKNLSQAALGQTVIVNAAANIVMVGIDARTAARYDERAPRYVDIETGHAAQNMLLQVTALRLAAVPVAAFQIDEVAQILDVEGRPLYILPIGRPAEPQQHAVTTE